MLPGFGPEALDWQKRPGRGALETLKTKWVFDENKRFNPEFYEDSESSSSATPSSWPSARRRNWTFFTPEDGVEISPRGLIAVNPADTNDFCSRRICRRGLRVRAAADHRQRGGRQARRRWDR